MTTSFDNPPLKVLVAAAARAREVLKLRYRPVVIRSEASAFAVADAVKGHAVMLGEDAFWVVCLADAQRLATAGFEHAPRPASKE